MLADDLYRYSFKGMDTEFYSDLQLAQCTGTEGMKIGYYADEDCEYVTAQVLNIQKGTLPPSF